jgi:OmpA-OmpF porin, OOP family
MTHGKIISGAISILCCLLICAATFSQEKPASEPLAHEALTKEIEASGHVIVRGIEFEQGKSSLPEVSAQAIREIAAMLKANPKMKIYITGHTDNAGDLAANIDLSLRRAEVVAAVLYTRHSIARDRILPKGIGSLSPVASNQTESGRVQNTRIEIVEQ